MHLSRGCGNEEQQYWTKDITLLVLLKGMVSNKCWRVDLNDDLYTEEILRRCGDVTADISVREHQQGHQRKTK